MTEQQHKALEACPFCAANLVRLKKVGPMQQVYCDGCGSSGPFYTDVAVASATWGLRASELRRLHAENEALRKQMEAQKDEWLSWNAKRDALEKDAERWREWLKGNALTVVVPTPTEKNPASKTTIVYAPSPYANFASAMSAATDAAITKERA